MTHILRNQSNVNFTTVDNEFIYNSSLSTKAAGLLIRLLALPDNWHFSKEGIYSIIPEGKKFVDSTLKELKEQGYLEIKKVKNYENNLWDYEYSVYSVSIHCEYLPDGNVYNFKTNKKGRGIISKNKQNDITLPDIDRNELFVASIKKMVNNGEVFSGTITDLKDLLPNSLNLHSAKLSKLLRDNIFKLKKDSIDVVFRRSNGKKIVQIGLESSTLLSTLKEKDTGSQGEPQKGDVLSTLKKLSVYRTGSQGEPQKGDVLSTLENQQKKDTGSQGEPQKGEFPKGGLYKRLNNKEIYRLIEKDIKKQIHYDELKNKFNKDEQALLDNIIDVLVDVNSSADDVLQIGKEKYQKDRVIETMSQLETKHIEYVIKNVLNQNHKIVNVYSYLLKSLFTAPKSFNLSKYSEQKNGLPDWYSDTGKKYEELSDDEKKEADRLYQKALDLQQKLRQQESNRERFSQETKNENPVLPF